MVLRLTIAAMLACAAGLPAAARPDPATDPAAARPGRETIEQSAARVVARLALTDLRCVGTPSESDYQIAASLIETAHALAPTDEPILRQLIEAQENAGNPGRVVELTRELIKLDPKDTVAQLRLISSRIRELQNADERLAAYDRWLGPDGASVDPSVLSRLAFDAALLAREKGDAKGFTKRLSRALELDATNKDAATLALAYYTQRVDDPAGQFELMLAVLTADPLDAELHLSMARHLAANNAFEGATRFFLSYNTVLSMRGQKAPPEEIAEYDLAQWRVKGPRSIIERYDQSLYEARQSVRRQREEAIKDKRPPESIPLPEQVHLDMAAEWVRFAAAVALGDPQLTNSAFDELIASAKQDSEHFSAPEKRPADMTDEEATDRIRGILEETVLARLLADKQPEVVAQGMDLLRGEGRSSRERMNNLEAFILVRKGELDAAEQMIKAQAETDPIAAVTWCTLLERRIAGAANPEAAKAAAAEALESLAKREAGSLPGAYAAGRYELLTGKPVPRDALAKRLDDLAAGVPSWLESILENPRRFQAIEAELVESDVRALDPVYIKLTIRNISPTPLSVGPDRPINSRFLLAPQVNIGIDSVKTGDKINVVSMERRLRLMPRDEFSAIVPADSPTLSLLLEQVSSRLARVRYRVIQGFEALEGGTYDAGPHCLATECGPVRRQVLPKSSADVPTLVRHAETGTARDVAESVLVVLGRSLGYEGLTPLTTEEADTFFAAVAKHLPELPTAGQLVVLGIMPTQGQVKKMKVIDDVARALPDPGVRGLYLATRAFTAEDPAFSDAATKATPAISQLGELVQARLRAGTPCYAGNTAPVSEPRSGGESAVQPADK